LLCVKRCTHKTPSERFAQPFSLSDELLRRKLHNFVILTIFAYTYLKDSVMRKQRFSSYELSSGCGVEACLEVVGGKWKGVILYHLMTDGVLRFNEIQRMRPSLSPRVLTAQLRELEQDGLIIRKVYPVVPPKVEYSLSRVGESLKPLIKAMRAWGDEHLLRTNATIGCRPKASVQANEEARNRTAKSQPATAR
jgi:DNA-binding HxlR family transcriptional regulator